MLWCVDLRLLPLLPVRNENQWWNWAQPTMLYRCNKSLKRGEEREACDWKKNGIMISLSLKFFSVASYSTFHSVCHSSTKFWHFVRSLNNTKVFGLNKLYGTTVYFKQKNQLLELEIDAKYQVEWLAKRIFLFYKIKVNMFHILDKGQEGRMNQLSIIILFFKFSIISMQSWFFDGF